MKDADGDEPSGPEKAKGLIGGSLTDNLMRGVANSEQPEITGSEVKEKKQGDTNKVKFRHAFQLHTQPEGYNSGRQYIIQARTEEERQKLVTDLTKFAKIANEKFLAKSQFRKIQVRSNMPTLSLFRRGQPFARPKVATRPDC